MMSSDRAIMGLVMEGKAHGTQGLHDITAGGLRGEAETVLAHGIPPLIHRSSVKGGFVVLLIVFLIFMGGNLPAKGRQSGVVHAYRVDTWHAETVWRGADSFDDGVKRHIFDKVASHGAGFEAFCLVHGVLVFNVSGCALALLCSPPCEGRAIGTHLALRVLRNHFAAFLDSLGEIIR
jgi:hypothetical protein